MDENKNEQNNMNYSFDFANQVEKEVEPVVKPMPANNEPIATTEVTPAEATPVATPTVASTENTSVTTTEVTPTVTSPVENQATTEPANNQTTPVPVGAVEENVEPVEDEAELIKDKKATKRFLIIIVIIIVAFIIALPFIFNIIG